MSTASEIPAIASRFAEYFANWAIHLPAKNLGQRQPGEIQTRGWLIRFRFGKDSRGEFLDFYASHRMTNDRHHRIYAHGTMEDLPALLEWVVYPANATAEQKTEAKHRFQEHNERVLRELERDGLA